MPQIAARLRDRLGLNAAAVRRMTRTNPARAIGVPLERSGKPCK
jgi:hypothetical protein